MSDWRKQPPEEQLEFKGSPEDYSGKDLETEYVWTQRDIERLETRGRRNSVYYQDLRRWFSQVEGEIQKRKVQRPKFSS